MVEQGKLFSVEVCAAVVIIWLVDQDVPRLVEDEVKGIVLLAGSMRGCTSRKGHRFEIEPFSTREESVSIHKEMKEDDQQMINDRVNLQTQDNEPVLARAIGYDRAETQV